MIKLILTEKKIRRRCIFPLMSGAPSLSRAVREGQRRETAQQMDLILFGIDRKWMKTIMADEEEEKIIPGRMAGGANGAAKSGDIGWFNLIAWSNESPNQDRNVGCANFTLQSTKLSSIPAADII